MRDSPLEDTRSALGPARTARRIDMLPTRA
jgi:hypothetical protein